MYCQHIILDFEMNPVSEQEADAYQYLRREIIEIGAVRLDEQLRLTDRFQCYVKPQYNTAICRNIRALTGSGFSQTNDAERFSDAMSLFIDWIGDSRGRIYSWSLSDLYQLADECDYKNIPFPACMYRWVDVQAVFPRMLRQRSYARLSLSNAAKVCGVTVDPKKAHGALYDAEVTAEILTLLLNGSYRGMAERLQSSISAEVVHSSFSLGSASGGALRQLMERMRADADEGQSSAAETLPSV